MFFHKCKCCCKHDCCIKDLLWKILEQLILIKNLLEAQRKGAVSLNLKVGSPTNK